MVLVRSRVLTNQAPPHVPVSQLKGKKQKLEIDSDMSILERETNRFNDVSSPSSI